MSFNFLSFAQDHGLQLIENGHKHCRSGWVQLETDCLFCTGNPGLHLGYNISQDYFRCWRCGHKWPIDVVAKYLNCSKGKASNIIKEYGGRPILRNKRDIRIKKQIRVKYPLGCDIMAKQHHSYLKKRGFDSYAMEDLWGLVGTGPIGPYKHRIIAPITFNNKMVSYQGRDITDKSELKYKACAQKDEAVDHQSILYGFDQAEGNSVIVVEGIFDVWRFGPGAVSCFGIEYTKSQVNLLAKYDKICIAFDPNEDQAEKQADLLGYALSSLGKDVSIVDLETSDPADMNQREADSIMKELIW